QKYLLAEKEKTTAELKLLKSQINPHFFFNVLSALQTLMFEKKNEQAIDYVSGFSILMRKVLEESNKEKASLEEEIEFLKGYLTLEKLSLDFEYEIKIEPEDLEVEDILVPTMLLQPFVENAIEHGLRKSNAPERKLTVSFLEVDQHNLQVSVRDNGAGRNKKQRKNHVSRALEITEDRQKLLKNSFNYKIIDHKDENDNALGTEAVFMIKI
ncbi:MAG: histidine kinase, partial [Bacteroidota bacterium]